MVYRRVHFSVCLVLVYQLTVTALPASRNFTVVKLFPPSPQQSDAGIGPVPQEVGKGIVANQRSAFLGNRADSFRFHRPGFEHVPGSVSLESATHPGLYLRYKNYKFHLERNKPTGVFEKDATFIERKTQTKGAAAYELFNHPGWFMCHDTSSKFGLVAKNVDIGSHEFLLGCLYMAVAQTPTKKDLKERLKLSPTKKESAEARANVRNFSGIISNDVSVENLGKDTPKNESGGSLAKGVSLISGRFNKTDDAQLSNKTNSGKSNGAPLALSNVTAGKNGSFELTFDDDSDTMNSTKQTNRTGLLHGLKSADVTLELQVTNGTRKPQIDLQKEKQEVVITDTGNGFSGKGKNKLEAPTTNKLESNPTFYNRLGKSSSSITAKINPLVRENTAAVNKNQTGKIQSLAQMKTNLQLKGNAIVSNKDIAGKIQPFARPKINSLNKGNFSILNKNPTGQLQSFVSKQATNQPNPYGKQQFTLNFEFPNEDKTTPNTLPNQLAKITAKALGFIHSAYRSQQSQQQQQNSAQQFTRLGPVFRQQQQPQQQQQQQKQKQQEQFQGTLNYLNQQIPPQKILSAPHNFLNAPALVSPGGPLVNQLAFKTPNSQLPRQQLNKPGPPQLLNSYKFPGKSWGGLISVGKQSLMGNSANFHNYIQNGVNKQGKSRAKLDDEPNKTSENDKCISLKFINKVRRPITLVSSMKLEGYLVTAETFKLKTIFKHPRKHHHVIFYARDSDDRDNEVLLNNNNAIAVTPGGCDMPFRSVVMSHHGQIGNKEIEHLRENDEYKSSMEAAKKAVLGKGDDNFTQWTAFGPCGATCGKSLQTRTRTCKLGKVCKGQSLESRTCIQTPCPVSICLKTYSGKCCALPFVFHGAVMNHCITDPQTHRSWCATTPNYDKEKRWGYCQPSGPHTEKVAPVIRSFLPNSPGQSKCPATCTKICMGWCPQRCCNPAARG
ncbi:uncharacterized protein LOC111335454 [Stylophora pistillata]|uniref:uncharacterized protein LOC111335454 n=1 Tax=Stylophora pistillata TaxID=50429 RepID=UPI000C04B095|nr:uncharacterized protein LOC111335454 [Stylophora pistillata]